MHVLFKYMFYSFLVVALIVAVYNTVMFFDEVISIRSCKVSKQILTDAISRYEVLFDKQLPVMAPINQKLLLKIKKLKYTLSCNGGFYYLDKDGNVRCSYHEPKYYFINY